ncbi:PaaI family thioesterase [Desulfonema magnum]|uniref:Phenylacetic acid degradation thioesterase n=1 Tax=Desulfonema magnum TaxID=45655 RepID=A0A975BTE5_9BACT|nr:PaaI family thioesterase [Desulfonema magnum]QTA91268.1 Phenylacetic acid degradation thioesterase [Desulfonema magnum]
MPELNPEHIKSVIEAINKGPFFMYMSMRVTELDIGFAKVVMNIAETHMNPFGGLHGGAYASVIDTAAYWSAYCDLPEKHGLVSIDIKIDFLSAVTGQKVIVIGNRIKSGRSIYLAEAKMTDENGKLLGYGTSKLMVTRNKQTINDAVKYVCADKLPCKYTAI